MEIKDIKSQLTIQQVLNHYHYKPTPKGAMLCPFHEPKKGNKQKKTFQVYTDTNRYQHKQTRSGWQFFYGVN